MSTPKFFTHDWGAYDWAKYRTGAKVWNWFDAIPNPNPNPNPGEAMPPTTSDRFFALAARVESALPDAGLTKEQAAELVGALKAYWEQPSEQALVALKHTQGRIITIGILEGKVNQDHNALSAHHALSRAAEAFFDNEPDTFMDVPGYFDRCEHRLEYKQ